MGPTPEQLVVMWMIISSVSLFAMIFGIRYMRNRENMAMIEKGMEPGIKRVKPEEPRPAPFRNLKWGLLLVGSGLGFFLAYLLDNFALYKISHPGPYDNTGANVPVYFALIAIFGGLGLIISYAIEKKELLNKQ